MTDFVCDTFLDGALGVWQPQKGQGYRFTLDPVLLAGFIEPAEHLLELGSGSGILGLLVLSNARAERVTMVEIQDDLYRCLDKNIDENGFSACATAISGDFRTEALPQVDAVAFNPPFFPKDKSRPGKNRGRDIGRREHYGTLKDFVACGVRSLKAEGSLYAVVRFERGEEFEAYAQALDLVPYRCRQVISRAGESAKHVLWQVKKTDKPIAFEEVSPLYVHHGAEGRLYSEEVQGLLGRSLTR